nr:non-structural polyprotein [Flumine dicistrovirus 19]
MPKHFITKLDAKVESGPEFKEIKIKLQKLNKNKTEQTVYYFKPEDFLSSVRETTALNELDLCMVHLKNGVQCHGSIVKYFGTLKELSDLREFNFRLIAPATDGTDVSLGKADIVVNHHVNPVDFTDYVIRKGFIYRAYTEEGDCGSLFTIMNPSYRTSKIFGFHVAGNSSMGFGLSTSVTREEIQTCLDSFGDDRIIENFESDTVPQCYMAISRGQFEPLYQVDKSINQAMKTQIKKSKLYGKWRPALTAPARLRPFYFKEVLVDPWDKAFDKYCTESVFIDKRSVILITNIYADWIYRVSTRNVEKRVYTHMESIMGLENDVDFKSISRSTSMGYPKNQESHVGFSGKQWLFGKEEVFDLNRQQAVELELECNIVVAKAILGERSLFIFADNLKDERRPLEKVETGATRLFNSSPVVLLLLYRRYFGAFQLWYMKNRINNGSAIGVNPYSDEWQLLANKLNQFRSKDYPTIGAGDYSRYDGSQKGVIHWSILSVINRWYGNNKQDDKVRSILWLELVCSKHIYKDIIYRWTSSLPSGFPLTALVNTMYNHIAFRWCYYSIFKDVKMLVEFPSYVYMCALGDDNVFGVRPKIHDLFNSATISEYMAKIGLTYTSELKDVTTSEFRLLEGVEFLKRSWRKETTLDRYVAPLRLEVVLETPYWTKRCHFADEITISNVNDSLIELALHGPKIFSDFSTVISKTLYEEYDTWPITTDFSVALSLSTSKESFF